MRHFLSLPKSSLLQATLSRNFARRIASETAVHCNEGPDKNGTLGHRWQVHESQVLIAGIEEQQLQLEKADIWNAKQSSKERWEEIESFCQTKGIQRSAEQCKLRWKRLLQAFYKIKGWESSTPTGKTSFWSMKASERKLEGLPSGFDWESFNAIDVLQNKKESWFGTHAVSSKEGETATSGCSEQMVQAFEDTSSVTLQTVIPASDERSPVLIEFIDQSIANLEGLQCDAQPDDIRATDSRRHGSGDNC